ncbi:hypothetical protein LPJ56_002539, partial [Coemansia sp. RSA 2599]
PQIGESPIVLFVPAWKYNDRYLAQPIVPHVLLGPYHLVRRSEFLQELGIKHILCIRDPSETLFLRAVVTDPPTEFHFIDVPSDVAKLSIIPYFAQANRMIKSMVESRENVLVCCSDGIDKSTSFVAAYLMSTYALKAVDAVTFVQNHRYCATPSPAGYRIKLLEYEPISAAQRVGSGGGSNGVARRRDDSDDDEEGGDGNSGSNRQDGEQQQMAVDDADASSGNDSSTAAAAAAANASTTRSADGHLHKRAR